MEVQLWWADLRDWRPRSFIDHLDTVESGRMNGYQQDADRERFAVGAVLLRLAAAEAMGKRSERIIVDRTCAYCRRAHGRPSIVGAEIGVSVSHSADIVVVATT